MSKGLSSCPSQYGFQPLGTTKKYQGAIRHIVWAYAVTRPARQVITCKLGAFDVARASRRCQLVTDTWAGGVLVRCGEARKLSSTTSVGSVLSQRAIKAADLEQKLRAPSWGNGASGCDAATFVAHLQGALQNKGVHSRAWPEPWGVLRCT